MVAIDGFTGFTTATTEDMLAATAVMDPFHGGSRANGPFRPQTRGKLERLHRTMADGWPFRRMHVSEPAHRCPAGYPDSTITSPPRRAVHRSAGQYLKRKVRAVPRNWPACLPSPHGAAAPNFIASVGAHR